MLQHSKRQVRYYKSQLYKTFVISDVCNPVCVLFLLKLRWPKTKSIYDTMKSLFKRKKFSTPVYARGQVSHGFLKSEKKKQGGSILIFCVWVFVDTILTIFKVNITLVQVYVAIRVFNFLYFIPVHFEFDYPIEFGP